jgi:hypothetical protein
MKKYDEVEFEKSILSGLFAGITATVLALIFNAYFRGTTNFSLSMIVNVSSIVFSLTILLTIAGIIFYQFHHFLKRGTFTFQLAAAALTALLLFSVQYVTRSGNPVETQQFRQLLLGIIAITGVCAIFLLPFLYKHDYI